MKLHVYHRGQWSEREVEDPGEDYDLWLRKFGFDPYNAEGNQCNFDVYVVNADSQERLGTALFAVGPDLRSHVLAVDEIDYADLYARWALMFVLSEMKYELEQLGTAVRRLFYAWHGHYPRATCPRCDPEENTKRIEASRRRKAAKSVNN